MFINYVNFSKIKKLGGQIAFLPDGQRDSIFARKEYLPSGPQAREYLVMQE